MKKNLQNTLGLTLNESRVYSALIKGVELDPSNLATETGLPRSRVYEVLASLSAKNLLEKRSDRSYRLIPPRESIPEMQAQLDREYHNKRQKIDQLGDYLHKVWHDAISSDLSPGVEIYTIEDSQPLFFQDIRSVSNRVWIAAADENPTIDMRKSGTELASIYTDTVNIRYLLSNPKLGPHLGERLRSFGPFSNLNVQIKANSELYSSFVMLDSVLYLFFFGAEDVLQASTLRTSSPQLVKSFEWMFDNLWQETNQTF